MRSLFMFLLGLFLGACNVQPMPPNEPRAPSHTSTAGELASKTVALVVTREGETRAYCSGVWVSSSLILTANHCMQEGKPGELRAYVVQSDVYVPGKRDVREEITARPAAIVSLDEEHDLALLHALAAPAHGVALLSIEPAVPGMHVHSMGNPLGLWFSYSSGDIAALRIESGLTVPTLMIQTTAPISPGNSGGGLYDEWGMLVGICHGSYTRGQNVNLFIHRQYADALLRKVPS